MVQIIVLIKKALNIICNNTQTCYFFLVYTLRRFKGPLACANLLERHFALILLLIALQILSFWEGDWTENLLNNKSFKEFSLAGSRRCLSKLPSVLLVDNSSLLKNKGSIFKAHLWQSLFLANTSWTPFTFLGVTSEQISPSVTWQLTWVGSVLGVLHEGVVGAAVEGLSKLVLSQTCLRTSVSMVESVSVTASASRKWSSDVS